MHLFVFICNELFHKLLSINEEKCAWVPNKTFSCRIAYMDCVIPTLHTMCEHCIHSTQANDAPNNSIN